MDTLRLNVPKSSYVIQQNICVFMCASMSPIGHSRPLCTALSVRNLQLGNRLSFSADARTISGELDPLKVFLYHHHISNPNNTV